MCLKGRTNIFALQRYSPSHFERPFGTRNFVSTPHSKEYGRRHACSPCNTGGRGYKRHSQPCCGLYKNACIAAAVTMWHSPSRYRTHSTSFYSGNIKGRAIIFASSCPTSFRYYRSSKHHSPCPTPFSLNNFRRCKNFGCYIYARDKTPYKGIR